ncbi:MFS transporter [Rhodococcus rhodochrous]|uniref:MFS transporter n=1 Tax=Rhodococcus rhodochrous TaxID=1829 RepID=UPI000AD13A68|nr:MFS transporter [Rhodococcus rhodochrous]MDO1485916.1 MFS transporter [Rhodococcus rhodochrous]TWH44763.1 putative MFS family arabinose efflux permease [Rhodococcus rhodochrous J38]SNV23770.1 MFS transporter [Rhodococcus rhodochrous]
MSITPPGLLGRRFWLLFAASTLVCTTTGTVAPALPQYIQNDLGHSATVVGIVVGAASVLSVIANPVLGRITDRAGRRRMGMSGAALGVLGMGVLLLAGGLWNVVGGRALFGIGAIALNVALTAWVVDAARADARGRALGMFGISVWIGLAAGPQIGQTLLHEYGFTAVWLACAAMQAGAFGCIAAAPRRPRTAVVDRTPQKWGPVVAATARPSAIAAAAWTGESILMSFLILHLVDRGVPSTGPTGAAAVFTVFSAGVVGFRLLLGTRVDRWRPQVTVAGALAATTAGYVVLAFASSFPVAAIGAALLGCGFSPLYPALLMLTTGRLHPNSRAAGLGVFTSGVELGLAVGVFAGGVLVDRAGGGAAMLGAAGFQIVAMVVLLCRPWRVTPSPAPVGVAAEA